MKDYDVIIIGGGINSLVSASLLTNQKKSVLLLESKNILGGTAAADEFSPGFKCNMVYDYLRWIDPRVIKELNLLNYGLEFREPNSLRVSLDEKGKHIFFNSDPNKTLESIASHSKDDANKWVDFTKFISKLTQFLEPLYAITPPLKYFELPEKDANSAAIKPEVQLSATERVILLFIKKSNTICDKLSFSFSNSTKLLSLSNSIFMIFSRKNLSSPEQLKRRRTNPGLGR